MAMTPDRFTRGRRCRRRRDRRVGFALSCAVAAARRARARRAPASALGGQGHVFGLAFTVEGEPSQVAVDEASGEVYVVDR